jgi:hypothetical protein
MDGNRGTVRGNAGGVDGVMSLLRPPVTIVYRYPGVARLGRDKLEARGQAPCAVSNFVM